MPVSYGDILLFHRHFLFKTGTGTTPLFSTATPGYTMASGSVYSPPTRPLPRNTLSRSAFKFKKSSKYCSWRCTALCAVGVSVLLAILLSYFIGKNKLLSHFACKPMHYTILLVLFGLEYIFQYYFVKVVLNHIRNHEFLM
jgi:hypothetical protein